MRKDEFPLVDKLREEAYQRGREDALDECLHKINDLSFSWEYGQGVSDCYDIVKQIKEQKEWIDFVTDVERK